MAATIKVFAFLSLLTVCNITVTGDDKCPYSSCRSEEAEVQFPFTLEGQQDTNCGYPGFKVSCDKSNRTVLDLGTSGKFLVRFINYTAQEVQIYDPDKCLPQRLMYLDLTGSPFKAHSYQKIDFYNCSSNISLDVLEPISCLSNSNYSVYAAASSSPRARYKLGLCDLFTTSLVPVREVYGQVGYVPDINMDLHLRWDVPDCGECVAGGGTCGFKNKNQNEIGCSDLPHRGLAKGTKYVIGLGIGGPGIFFVLLMACYVTGRVMVNDDDNNLRSSELSSSVLAQPPISIIGLDEAIIQSYPKFALGETPLAYPEDNICSICLSEYRVKETLKTIPDCKHCFHAACIDQWLRRNVTCPLCRNFPEQAPVTVTPSV